MLVETGYLESMTPAEKEIMLKIKQFLKDVYKIDTPKIWNRWFILRFCRARKFDYEKIVIMINQYIAYMKEINADQVGQIAMERYEDLKDIYSHGYYGVDKLGRPIYIEEVKKFFPDKIFAKYTDLELTHYYIQSYERMIHIVFPECSRLAGRRIDKSCAIMDLKDVSTMSLFAGKVKTFIKIASEIAQNYYPECLGSMYVLNAGILFSGIWLIVKGWIDVKTQKKINIISGKGKEELAKIIDKDRLPLFLHGTCEVPLRDNHGPWQTELKNSYANRTLLHSDPNLIKKYYWDNEEHEEHKDKADM